MRMHKDISAQPSLLSEDERVRAAYERGAKEASGDGAWTWEDGWRDFWAVYPRKVAGAYAKICYRRLVSNRELAAKIVASVTTWKTTKQWQDRRFIPYPSTFLNRHQWADEMADGDLTQGALIERRRGPRTRPDTPDEKQYWRKMYPEAE